MLPQARLLIELQGQLKLPPLGCKAVSALPATHDCLRSLAPHQTLFLAAVLAAQTCLTGAEPLSMVLLPGLLAAENNKGAGLAMLVERAGGDVVEALPDLPVDANQVCDVCSGGFNKVRPL